MNVDMSWLHHALIDRFASGELDYSTTVGQLRQLEVYGIMVTDALLVDMRAMDELRLAK